MYDHKVHMREYYHKNKKRMRKEQLQYYYNNVEESQKRAREYYRKHKDEVGFKLKRADSNKRSIQKLRMAILVYYGGSPPKCACCGEAYIEFLCIDHIDGNGNKHRKEVKAVGNNIYFWLKKNKYPKGFRILCHNCNLAKGFYGYCPHSEEDKRGNIN